jgi:hypothetical protein
VPPPHSATFSLSAQATSASRISPSCASASSWSLQMPVDISIMLSLISGTTLPGSDRRATRRSRSAALGVRS